MALFLRANRSVSTFLLQAGLLVLFLYSFLQPVALQAAPIVFQATTLTSGGCGSILSGDNFVFDGTLSSGGTSCGGRDGPVGIPFFPMPTGPPSYFSLVMAGAVNVPGSFSRVAVLYGGGQPSLYKDVEPSYVPQGFTGPIDINVVLSGTVQVCLEPASVQDFLEIGPCDPAFVNFGVININVAGLAHFYANDGDLGARNFGGFYGTSAAAPESSHLGLAGGALLSLLAPFNSHLKRRGAALKLLR